MIYPIVLILCSLTIFIIFEITVIYLSEMGFLLEMKEYYQRQIKEVIYYDKGV